MEIGIALKVNQYFALPVISVEWEFYHVQFKQGSSNKPLLVSLRILLIFIAILSAYSIHLLLKSAGVVGKPVRSSPHINPACLTQHAHMFTTYVAFLSGIRAYEQLGNRAFGHPGKMLAACIITIHNIGGIVAPLFIFSCFISG